jgi:hypothetical protein
VKPWNGTDRAISLAVNKLEGTNPADCYHGPDKNTGEKGWAILSLGARSDISEVHVLNRDWFPERLEGAIVTLCEGFDNATLEAMDCTIPCGTMPDVAAGAWQTLKCTMDGTTNAGLERKSATGAKIASPTAEEDDVLHFCEFQIWGIDPEAQNGRR